MGFVLFVKWKVLLRTVYNVYAQVKQRDFDHAVGYGFTMFKNKRAENYELELQSVWITAHRWFDSYYILSYLGMLFVCVVTCY
jgi:hypothetical protein